MFFFLIIFQNTYMELEPPPPLHGKIHLKFPFWLFDYFPKKLSMKHKMYSDQSLYLGHKYDMGHIYYCSGRAYYSGLDRTTRHSNGKHRLLGIGVIFKSKSSNPMGQHRLQWNGPKNGMLQPKTPEDVRGHYVQTRGQVQNLWDVNSSEQVLVDARICHNMFDIKSSFKP